MLWTRVQIQLKAKILSINNFVNWMTNHSTIVVFTSGFFLYSVLYSAQMNLLLYMHFRGPGWNNADDYARVSREWTDLVSFDTGLFYLIYRVFMSRIKWVINYLPIIYLKILMMLNKILIQWFWVDVTTKAQIFKLRKLRAPKNQ